MCILLFYLHLKDQKSFSKAVAGKTRRFVVLPVVLGYENIKKKFQQDSKSPSSLATGWNYSTYG